MNLVDHGMDIATATATPRIHHQWLPDELEVERGLSRQTLAKLARMGSRSRRAVPWAACSRSCAGEEGFSGPRTRALRAGWRLAIEACFRIDRQRLGGRARVGADSMVRGLTNRVALVTGGSTGIRCASHADAANRGHCKCVLGGADLLA